MGTSQRRADCRQRVDLSGADLGGANLGGGADRRGAKLGRASLYEARLDGARFHDADLSKAGLGGAELRAAVRPYQCGGGTIEQSTPERLSWSTPRWPGGPPRH